MENWNYANLSRLAKSYGGPEKMFDVVKAGAELKGALKGGAIATGSIGLGVGGYFLGRWVISKLKERISRDKQIEQELMKGINEFDLKATPENSQEESDN